MSGEAKDPAIKLFGKTIPLPDIPPPLVFRPVNNPELVLPLMTSCSSPEHKQRREDVNEEEDDEKELIDRNRGSSDNDPDQRNKSKSNNSQDKTLKKPDKILPCPRCNSMDTKFCYYNNYNVNQPRHFCKNCQRYWTAGGTMRNVPVGAGRRKNKTPASNPAPEFPEPIPNPNSGFPNKIPGSHWPYSWSLVPPPVLPVVPPFYPAPAYWVPLLPCSLNSSSGLNSPTLGKRSRDEAVRSNVSEPIKSRVLMPRVYDTREAAKSSIWDALSESPGGGIFKGFQPKGHDKNHIYENDSVMQANPAALSRSLNFHEAR